jgi:glucose-1-phosphate thymidylyltransferase
LYERLLGNGDELGVRFKYAAQEAPNGLAEAFIIGREFIGDDYVCLILGDNIFYGAGLAQCLQQAVEQLEGALLFGYHVEDPERYGVADVDANGNLLGIEEKPTAPKSRIAVTGLYFYDNQVVEIASRLKPSARGELEITDVNNVYIANKRARMEILGRGYAWLDTGTQDSLLDAGHFVASLERRQGTYIACLEEIAYRMNYISAERLRESVKKLGRSQYGKYLVRVLEEGYSGSIG